MGKRNETVGDNRINFVVTPATKKAVEVLARSTGKSLSAFMVHVCERLITANKSRIDEQAEREKADLNFDISGGGDNNAEN